MRRDIIWTALAADAQFEVVEVVERPDELAAVLERETIDVVVMRPLAPELPPALAPIVAKGEGPAVVGVDRSGQLGVVMVDRLGPDELRSAVHASVGLRQRAADGTSGTAGG